MFERFTAQARAVVVGAQEEARALGHNYIGTEHLLLGLIAPPGLAQDVLSALDIDLDGVRAGVMEIIGPGKGVVEQHIPFTPRAKRVLELALRDALSMGNNFIGTEHLLLGLLREGEGVAVQVLTARGVDLEVARARVLEAIEAGRGAQATGTEGYTVELTVAHESEGPIERALHPSCPRCRGALEETARFKTITIPEDEGDGEITARVVFCGACGTILFET